MPWTRPLNRYVGGATILTCYTGKVTRLQDHCRRVYTVDQGASFGSLREVFVATNRWCELVVWANDVYLHTRQYDVHLLLILLIVLFWRCVIAKTYPEPVCYLAALRTATQAPTHTGEGDIYYILHRIVQHIFCF